jgi:ATP-dependent Clp protease ATP-binding subunit ClpA
MAAGAVPPPLQGRRVFELRLGSLLAGTQYRGELEKRVDELLKAAQAIGAIVFIDEIHLLTQAGKGSGLDVGNLLKPALARGDFSCIGATTPAEVAEFFRLDPAFERRFQSLLIEEPDPLALIAILQEAAKKLSSFHQVTIDESAILAASNAPPHVTRYGARKNPDRALDLLEDACAAQQLQSCQEELNTPTVPHDVLTLKKQVDEAAAQLDVFRHIENRAAYDDALAAWHRSKAVASQPVRIIGAEQILAVLKTRESASQAKR